MPRKSMTLLYDRFGKPFDELANLRERINDLVLYPKVREAIDEAIALGELAIDVVLHPHGIRKNAACHLI